MAEQLANNAQALLQSGISAGDTSLTLVSGGSAFSSTGNFRIAIDGEIILVGARSGNVLSSLTRGAEGTTAASHSAGATVTQVLTAAGLAAYLSENAASKPSSIASGEVPVWNGSTWVRSTTTRIGLTSMGSGTPAAGKYVDGAAGAWTALPAVPTVITGRVSSAGALVLGTGWSVVHTGTGIYTITWDVDFASEPVMEVTQITSGVTSNSISCNPGTHTAVVYSQTGGVGPVDIAFMFTARLHS